MNDWLTNIWNDPRRITPARAVTHPAWILAVFVLLVNDHIIKPAAFAEPIAGKLSDLAGLFLFPALLATLLALRTRRGLWLVAGATAAVFAAINTVPALAAVVDAAISVITPFHTTVDPTDLVALVAIPLGIWFFEPIMGSQNARFSSRALQASAVIVGGIACMATSPPPCDDCVEEINQTGQVSILNKTNELHILRMRGLRGGIRLDCDLVRDDPGKFLVDDAFGAPQSWFVQSGQEIPVSGAGQPIDQGFNSGAPATNNTVNECSAALIESDTVPDIFVVWDRDLPSKSFAFDADVPQEIPADPQTVVLDADYSRVTDEQRMHEWRERSECGERADLCGDELLAPLATLPEGARYFWRSRHDTELHFPRPNDVEGTLPDDGDSCRVPTAADSLAWEQPPSGELYVVGFNEGRDGCHELSLTVDPDDPDRIPRGWWLCAPAESLSSMVPGDTERKRIIVTTQNRRGTTTVGGYRGLEISVFTLDDTTGDAALETIHLSRGYSTPDDLQPRYIPIPGCEPTEVECGQVSLPVDVELGAYSEVVRPGESVSVGEVQPLDVHIVRAETRPVVDTTCTVGDSEDLVPAVGAAESIGYIEAVVVRRNAGRE